MTASGACAICEKSASYYDIRNKVWLCSDHLITEEQSIQLKDMKLNRAERRKLEKLSRSRKR